MTTAPTLHPSSHNHWTLLIVSIALGAMGTACCGGGRATAPVTNGTPAASTQLPPANSAIASAPHGTKPACTTPSTLKAAAACTSRLVGTAVTVRHLDDDGYIQAAREFDYVTAENEMKWDTVEPTRGTFNFAPGDEIVGFAQQNGMQVKGHTLVWHNQLPSWVNALENAHDVRTAMLNHVRTTVEHYKGKVAVWDVVNEAWDTEKKTGDGNPVLRDSIFYKYLGASFIDEAFRAAHEADPNAKLYYNDYSAEGMNDKSEVVYGMLKAMIKRGVPVHGVGLQMHIGTPNDTPTIAELKQNMQRLAALGLEIVISEMDVNSCDGVSPAQEATIYHDVVASCVAQPACKAVTFWGITDKYSWLNRFKEAGCTSREPTPLLWDDSYNEKPAYRGVIDAFSGR